ncbi:hypothetical protein [Cupriavidus necator]
MSLFVLIGQLYNGPMQRLQAFKFELMPSGEQQCDMRRKARQWRCRAACLRRGMRAWYANQADLGKDRNRGPGDAALGMAASAGSGRASDANPRM